MDKQSFSLYSKIILLAKVVCIGLVIFNGGAGATEPKHSDIIRQEIQKSLTDNEKAWLSSHRRIRIAGPKAFPPFHYYEQGGTLKGMASDYIKLIFKYLDITPVIQSNVEWPDVLKKAEEREIDLISCAAKTMEREQYLGFTQPYLSFPLVIITKNDAPFIGGLDDLHGKQVAFIKGAAAYDWIRRDKINVRPYYVKTPLEGLKAVSLGRAKAHIENLATATYLIQKQGLANLKIAAPAFNENYDLYIAVRKDWPELTSIINKILAAITPEQHSAMRKNWLSMEYEYGIPKMDVIKWGLGISGIAFIILAMILMWNRRLSQEINERKLAEEALGKSEAKFRLAFHTSPDSINLNRASDGMYVDINEGFTKILGYSREDAIGKTSLSLNIWKNPEDRQRLVDKLAEKGYAENLIAEFVGKNGNIRMGMMSARIIQVGDENLILSVTRDITKLKKAEDALRRSEEKFRQIYENILDIYYEASLDGFILEISPSIERISHYKRKELIGKSLYDIYTNPGDRDELVEIVLDKGSVRDYELILSDKDGTQHLCSMNIELIKDNEDNPEKIVGIFRDISDHKKAENEKLAAQKIAAEHEKMAVVGQVAGKMAHDFNNVLGIIMGNTELSLFDCKEPETKKKLELIYKQTLRGRNLTKNLVAFAKDQEPKQEVFKINEKINLVIDLLKKDLEGIELIQEDKSDVPDVIADPGMIEHALINLIQNAIHATSKTKHPKIIVRTYCSDGNICFEIEDNGCGIPEKYLHHIYEPSFTLKGNKDETGSYETTIKGTGYGMANVKKYIEQHKGNLLVETVFGSGTKFTIGLPILKKEKSDLKKKEYHTSKQYTEKNILVVEDELSISDIQSQILTQASCSHRVDIAGSGKIARELLTKKRYDLISLDYSLPGNISGMDVYHHIRKTNKTIPILFVSGNIEFLESIKNLKQNDPYLDHQSKPCMKIDYLNSINTLFGKKKI